MKDRVVYSGSGGMDATIYDPQQKKQDIFNYIDNIFPTNSPNFIGSGNPFGAPLNMTPTVSAGWTSTSPYTHTPGTANRLDFTLENEIPSWKTGQYHLKFTITGRTAGSINVVYTTNDSLGTPSSFTILSTVTSTNTYGYYAPVYINQSWEAVPDIATLGFIPTSTFDGAISDIQLLPIDNFSDYYKMPVSTTYTYNDADWHEEPVVMDVGTNIYKSAGTNDTPVSFKIDLVKGKTYWVALNITNVEARFGKTATDRTGPIYTTQNFTASDDYSYINFWALGTTDWDSDIYIGWSSMGAATVNNTDIGVPLLLNNLPLATSGSNLQFNDRTLVTQNDISLLKPKKITLWDGIWSINGSITFDLSPYEALPQYLFAVVNNQSLPCTYLINNDVRFGNVHYHSAAGVITWFAQINRNSTTNVLTLASCGYVGHIPSGNHSAVTTGTITEIYTIGFTL